jgi:hypothetical protein
MNYNNLNNLIWLPLAALSVTLLAFFLKALVTRRLILKECRATEEWVRSIVRTIERITESTSGRCTIRELRQMLAARVEKSDQVVQLLVESPGAALDAQVLRIDRLVQKSYGGDLSHSVYTVGNLAVVAGIAVTATKIVTALTQMDNADPARISAVIGHGLVSTVIGATLLCLANLLNWLVIDGPVEQITGTLTQATCVIADACLLDTPAITHRAASVASAGNTGPVTSVDSGRSKVHRPECTPRPPTPRVAQSDHAANANGDHPYAPL